jgi:hypothetical protein
MTRKFAAWTALYLLAFSASAFAGESNVPRSGLFIGLGGGYDVGAFEQYLSGNAVSDVYDGSTLVASGAAGGPTTRFRGSGSAFGPEVQLGYYSDFPNSDWLWDVKFTYQYPGMTIDDDHESLPQTGSFTAVDGTTTPFTGHVAIGSNQITINHELILAPYIGRFFKNSYVYLGAGPALFGTKSNLNNAVGYAEINGETVDVTGAPASFSSSKWVWGGAVQLGMAYYLTSRWFLDFNYTLALSASYKTAYSAKFSSSNNGLTTSGTAFINAKQTLTSQSLMVSINRVFH